MTFLVGTAGTFTVTATGTPTPTVSETGALPAGVTFSAATGTLSGMPAAGTAGTYPIIFTAHNGAGADATQNFTLVVNQASAITSANTVTFTVGTAGTFTVTATGSPTPTLSETGSLPAGVTFTVATGTLSGMPAANTGGTYSITFTAHNGVGADATQNFTLTVNQAPAITTNPANQMVTAGSNATFTASASGSPAPTVQWQVSTNGGATFTNVAGATSATLAMTSVMAGQTGNQFRAIFTNTGNTATTTAATLTVVPAPAITSFTSGAARITAGNSTTLTAMFSGGTGSVDQGLGGVTSGTPVNISPSTTTVYTLTVTNAAGTSVTAQSTLTVVAAPAITSFTAGATTITAGNSTTLTAMFSGGTGSVDHGVGAVAGGTAVNITPSISTTYTLTVTNAAGASVTANTTVTVVAAPVITSFSPGAAMIVSGNSTTLTAMFSGGTGSVNNGVGTVTNATAVPVTPSATTTYTLTVTNAAGTSVTAQATVTVVAAPVITSFTSGAAALTAGISTTLTAVFSGGTGSVNNGVGAVTSATAAPVTPSATTTYTLTVTNAAGTSVTQQATVTVVAPPVITSFTPGAAMIVSGNSTTLTAVFSGTGSVDQGVGAVTSGTPVNISPTTTTVYTLTVSNTATTPANVTAQTTVTVNQAPAITTNPANQTVTAGSNASFAAVASGSPAPTVQWQVSTDNGVTFNSVGGATSATLGLTAVTGTQNGNKYRAVFTNTVGSATTTAATLGVVALPAITGFTAGATTITAGNSTTLTAVFNGTGSVDQGVGAVSNGTPVNISPSTTTVYTLTVTNGAGATVTAQATVTVVAAPVITSFTSGAAALTAGNTTTLTAMFSGGTGSVDQGVGAVAGGKVANITPAISTTYTLTVTNVAGASVTANTTVTVVAAPVITSFTAGATTITAGNPTTLTAVFSAGMTGSVDQGLGVVTSGTPVNISPTTTTVYTLTVSNTATTPATVTAQTTVTVNQAPTIISANSTNFTVGSPGIFTLTASGGITPYTWSWAAATGSSLPSGLNISTKAIDNTGLISGTPTTAGSFSVVVTATDSQFPGAKASATLNIVIAPPPALLITSGNPVNGTAGSAYGSGGNGFTLTATGGVKPFTWSWAAKSGSGSQTPPGLGISTSSGTNNGLIAGVPSSAGSFQVTVTVTDSTTATVSADYNITFTASPSCIPGPATLCGQFTFLAQGSSGTSEAPVMIAGTFTADGKNHITAGILDFNSASLTQTQVPIILGPATAYQVGQDGRGTITLGTSTIINGTGTIQFTFALNSTGTFAFLFESDDVSTTGTGDHASGYMQAADLTKFTAASISGGYALGLLGGTSSATRPRSSAIAAVSASGLGCGLASNGNGLWINDAGVASAAPTSFTCGNGGLTTIDPSTGRGTITIVLAGAGPFSTQSLNFSFYVIDDTKLIFISTDSAGLNLPILSGTMFKQLKTSFISSDLACGFREANNIACIFGLSGESAAGSHVGAGRAVGTSGGELTITTDDNNGGVLPPTKTTAGWTVNVLANGLGTLVPPFSANSSSAEFVLIDTDNAILAVADGSVQVGVIRRQTASAPSPAPGRFIFSTQLVGNGKVSDASGFIAVAPPAPNPSIAGTIDLEQTIVTPTEVTGAAFNGTYSMDASPTGRGTGSSAAPGPSQFIIYNVGPKEIILLESDSTNKQPMLIDLIQ